MTDIEFIALCEAKLKECDDPKNIPFPLIGEAAQGYLLGRKVILQWILEMMPLDKAK